MVPDFAHAIILDATSWHTRVSALPAFIGDRTYLCSCHTLNHGLFSTAGGLVLTDQTAPHVVAFPG